MELRLIPGEGCRTRGRERLDILQEKWCAVDEVTSMWEKVKVLLFGFFTPRCLLITCANGTQVSFCGWLFSSNHFKACILRKNPRAAGRLVLCGSEVAHILPTRQNGQRRVRKRQEDEADLLGWALHEVDASLDVGLETFDGFIQELLLVVVGTAEDVDGLFSTLRLGKI
jgi:hypothetical protein